VYTKNTMCHAYHTLGLEDNEPSIIGLQTIFFDFYFVSKSGLIALAIILILCLV